MDGCNVLQETQFVGTRLSWTPHKFYLWGVLVGGVADIEMLTRLCVISIHHDIIMPLCSITFAAYRSAEAWRTPSDSGWDHWRYSAIAAGKWMVAGSVTLFWCSFTTSHRCCTSYTCTICVISETLYI